ncbi:hypothetical protein [Desulfobacula sp.]
MYHNRIMNAMKAMNKKNVMIITPPMTSPAMPSFTGAIAAGCLARAAINTVSYDANLDFFVNHVCSKRLLKDRFKKAVQKKEKGLIPAADFRIMEKIFQRLSSQFFSPDFFRSQLFYEPEKYLAARNRLDDLFLLYSCCFYPSRIRWSSLPFNDVDDMDDSLFMSLCREKLDVMLKKVLPKVAIFALDSENQIFAVNTMITYIKSVFPEIQTVILQGKTDKGNKGIAVDQSFSLQDLPLFFNWIDTTWKCENQYIDIEPDFSIFPLNDYLTPELILPVQASFFKEPFLFWEFVAKLNDKFCAKGFLFDDLLFSFDIFSKTKDLPGLFFGIQSVMEDWDKNSLEKRIQTLFSFGMTMVQWKIPEKKRSLEIKMLWDLSKQGIWNHVKLKALADNTMKNNILRFVSSNPNIVHSYENLKGKGPYRKPDLNEIDTSLQAYSGVKQMPGEPFWKILSDPAHLLLYLKHHGKKNLFCLRADRTSETIISLGSGITFHFRKPDDLEPGLIDEICAMVEAGGSVDIKYVRYNLEKAYLIGFAKENGIIVGNSSLKHPRQEFIQRLNTITGLDFNNFVERGYTSVRPEYRALGVGARLLEGLTKRAGQYKIFSIISQDNTATQKIAKKNKTKKIATYYSEKVGKELGVWMPEHMIEKEWGLNL